MHQRPHVPSSGALKKRYGFLRLPLAFDAAALRAEIDAARVEWISADPWKWHMQTSLSVLRAGREGKVPGACLTTGSGIDKPSLRRLPLLRSVLDEGFGDRAAVAWLGLVPPGARIFLHVDNTQHWDEHHRVHVPIVTSPGARMCSSARFVHMPAGSAWLFNNALPHGVLNEGPARVHLLVDLPDTDPVRALLRRGERVRGALDPAALSLLERDPLSVLTPEQRETSPHLRTYLRQ